MGDINAKVAANLFLNYDGGPFHAMRMPSCTRRWPQGAGRNSH
jgi:hypothetical protein